MTASNALETITTFIKVRGYREGESFPFASFKIRYPHEDELLAAFGELRNDGVIEDSEEGSYKLTKAGYLKFFGEPPSEDDAIRAIMREIETRGIKVGKSFLWAPIEEQLRIKHFRPAELQPAFDKILTSRWLENAPMPGFFKLTAAGQTAMTPGQ